MEGTCKNGRYAGRFKTVSWHDISWFMEYEIGGRSLCDPLKGVSACGVVRGIHAAIHLECVSLFAKVDNSYRYRIIASILH